MVYGVERVMKRERFEGKAEGKAEGKVEGKAEGKVEGKAEGKVEGKAEGKAEVQIEIAKELLERKMGIVTVSEITKLPIATIRKLLEEIIIKYIYTMVEQVG